MMKRNRILALVLGLALLTACTPKETEPTATPAPTAAPTETPAGPEAFPVNVAMLKGPTGLGAAKFMEQAGGEDNFDYRFSVLAEPTEAVAGLTKGEIDIAALPTNLAATLYHKLDGGVTLLALNTYGVLYILENGESIQSMADLEGKTVHAYGQGANPEFVLHYLLEKNQVDPQRVDIQWHGSTDEVTALMASGEGTVCMLPVPAATAVLMQNENVRQALDLTQEWNDAGGDGVLTMGCLVARTEFLSAHRQAVETFLEEYAASIAYMTDPDNLEAAAQLAETYGIVPKAAVAKRALPAANLCFVTGEEMKEGIQGYYQVLFQADPASIGGSLPDSAFYYTGK